MQDNNLKDFIIKVKCKSTKHKVTNSYGVYDAYKYYRKNKPKDKKYILTESQYFNIVRTINTELGDLLANGEDLLLPLQMGRIEVRKYETTIKLVDGKIKTNLPIDWVKTLQLWFEDEESHNSKTLIRREQKEVFKFYYNSNFAKYKNKSFYQFKVNRKIKLKLKENIINNNLDAFYIKR